MTNWSKGRWATRWADGVYVAKKHIRCANCGEYDIRTNHSKPFSCKSCGCDGYHAALPPDLR